MAEMQKAVNLVNQFLLISMFFCMSVLFSCYSELSVAESLSGADKTMTALVPHTERSWQFLNEIMKFFQENFLLLPSSIW